MNQLKTKDFRSLGGASSNRKLALLDAVLDCVAMTGMLVVAVLTTLIMGL